MSSSNGTPPVDATAPDSAAFPSNGVLDAGEKPRLTEEEKKQNHIASGKHLSPPPPPLQYLSVSCFLLFFLEGRSTIFTRKQNKNAARQ